jgi:flagellar basal-body rod protein FlgB
MIDKIFDKTLPLLQKHLDLNSKRMEALVSNVTNAETPGYRAVDVNFAGELERAAGKINSPITKTDVRHIDTQSQSGMAHLTPDFSGVTKPDGNNVDIDLQMGKLTKASSEYSQSANLIRKKLGIIKFAIRSSQ